jgi:hypothetical protein
MLRPEAPIATGRKGSDSADGLTGQNQAEPGETCPIGCSIAEPSPPPLAVGAS